MNVVVSQAMVKPQLSKQTGEGLEPSATVHLGFYLGFVLFLPFAMLLLAFPIARSDAFMETSRPIYWHAMDYHAHMGVQNCAVVVSGDSTGIAGINPLIVEAQTGLKTCVLSMEYMALAATGNSLLDSYLAQNSKPRLIIFVTHARHLHAPTFDDTPGIIDGWLMVDRLMPVPAAAVFFVRHPRLTFIFAAGIWQHILNANGALRPDLSRDTYREHIKLLRLFRGYIPIRRQMNETAICAVKIDPPSADPGYLPYLQERYGGKGTKVWVYASPVRSCDENIPLYRAAAHEAGISPPSVYPPVEFSDWYHLDEQGAARNSTEIALRIQKELLRR